VTSGQDAVLACRRTQLLAIMDELEVPIRRYKLDTVAAAA
jgi:hypothetical protein